MDRARLRFVGVLRPVVRRVVHFRYREKTKSQHSRSYTVLLNTQCHPDPLLYSTRRKGAHWDGSAAAAVCVVAVVDGFDF